MGAYASNPCSVRITKFKLPLEIDRVLDIFNVTQLTPSELDLEVEQIQFELGDTGDDFNIRRIVERMPDNLIKLAIHDAVGRKSDGMLKTSAVAYFVGRMKNVATERGIDLGFK